MLRSLIGVGHQPEGPGVAEGRREGILKTLSGLIHKGILSLKDAALEAMNAMKIPASQQPIYAAQL